MNRPAARRRIGALLNHLPITCWAELYEWEVKGRASDLRKALDSRVCRQEGRESACWCGKNMTRERRAQIEESDPVAAPPASADDDCDPWETPAIPQVGEVPFYLQSAERGEGMSRG